MSNDIFFVEDLRTLQARIAAIARELEDAKSELRRQKRKIELLETTIKELKKKK